MRLAGTHRPKGQIAGAEQLAGVRRSFVDPLAQADLIINDLRPMLAARLAEAVSPLPAAEALDAALAELEAAWRAYDRAKAGNGRLTIYRTLQRVEKAVVAVCEASREAGHGSR